MSASRRRPDAEETALDVAIVGGGVAGAACALAAARRGLRVVLLEAEAASRWRIGDTLAPEARPVLQALGVWDQFQQAGHVPSHGHVAAWGGEAATETDLIFQPYGSAWQIDRARFEEDLLGAAQREGARVMRGVRAGSFARTECGWSLGAMGAVLRARWLVDATGRRSFVARQCGIRRFNLDRQVAVYRVAVASSGMDSENRTMIESAENGWWYSAPLRQGRRLVAFLTDADLLPSTGWRGASWFDRQLASCRLIPAHLEPCGYTFPAEARVAPAQSGCMEACGGSDWLAIGDAAMTLDPLSGHGLVKALDSGRCAAEVMADATGSVITAFHSWNATMWQHFVESRWRYYASERRWSDAPFWSRRHSQHTADPRHLPLEAASRDLDAMLPSR